MAKSARAELIAAQRAYRRAMRNAFAADLPTVVIARAIGARQDAVRMYRKRSRA